MNKTLFDYIGREPATPNVDERYTRCMDIISSLVTKSKIDQVEQCFLELKFIPLTVIKEIYGKSYNDIILGLREKGHLILSALQRNTVGDFESGFRLEENEHGSTTTKKKHRVSRNER